MTSSCLFLLEIEKTEIDENREVLHVDLTGEIYLVTIPEAASPNTPSSINHWNDLIGTLQSSNIILLTVGTSPL